MMKEYGHEAGRSESEISLPAKNKGNERKVEEIIVARHSHIPMSTPQSRGWCMEVSSSCWCSPQNSQKRECMSRLFARVKMSLLRPLAAGSEFQGDLRAPHEEVQYAKHAARNSKDKGRKRRWHASAAGRARQRRLGRRPRIHREMPLCGKHGRENPQNSASPQSEKVKKEKTGKRSPLTHETTAHFHRSARLRAQRRDARAVVLRLMRVAVAGGDDGGRGGAGETEEERKRTRRSGDRGTEEWRVWRANEKEQGEGTSTKDTQGERRGRMDDEGQDYEGKLEAGGGGGRWQEERGVKSHARRMRWRNEGGVDHGLVEKCGGRCEREGGSRAARDGEEGGGERHGGRHRESRAQIVRIDRRQDTHAHSASKECHLACVSRARGCVDYGWIRDGRLSRRDLHAGARGRAHIGGRWNEERGVYGRRCEDGIAEYAQVMLHAARDTLAWSTTGCGVGVGEEGAPNLSEVLARRFERHGPRIERWMFRLRNEKIRQCTYCSTLARQSWLGGLTANFDI
ncbi:hypothetical protein B0H13DRAFT_2448050 [Mycena leptocephala]|nr:hypothetical protein B0H13DRAFT_2448050 [Mycena leptocephala]